MPPSPPSCRATVGAVHDLCGLGQARAGARAREQRAVAKGSPRPCSAARRPSSWASSYLCRVGAALSPASDRAEHTAALSMLACRSELHSPEEKHHEHRMAARNTLHQCKDRLGMYRKGGRGTHQQHRNCPGWAPRLFRTGKTGCPPISRLTGRIGAGQEHISSLDSETGNPHRTLSLL